MDAMRAKNRCSDSLRWASVLTVVMALILSCPVLSPAQSATVYVYDALGRVVGVVNPAGNAAVYTYDAAGNIISISTYSSTQVSIMTLTPNRGPVGSTVTVYGTGFSTTASQDTLKFNGTQASIVSASSNAIVTEVPSGATTGTVTVTTPAGSASSSTPFTVQPSQAPTISTFTPKIGAAGTTVAVVGTNFQPVASDTVRLNGTDAPVTTATASTIQASVSAVATSGHISVATPFGQATSTGDFFAAPSPFTASQVVFDRRMSVGTTESLSIPTAGDIGLMIFDETIGHRVTLAANNSTFADCGLTLSIISPSNQPFTSEAVQGLCGSAFLSTPVLTENGTYTILAQPYSTTGRTGTVALSLYDIPQDFSSSITAGGPPVDVSLTIPGQMARLTFAGTSGQNVSVNFTNGTSICKLNLTIFNPDGSTLYSTTCVDPSDVVSQQILPMTGTYTMVLTPAGLGTGKISVALYDVTNVTGTITIGGPAVPVTLGTPGQIANLTFSGTAGQSAKVFGTNNSIECVTVAILNPTGATVVSELECESPTFNLPSRTLPTTGTYTLSIVPYEAYTGSLTVQITSP